MAISTITVLGTGYVGLTTAALLVHAGYTVYAVEPHKERLDVIKQGRSFFYEAGLDPIVKTALDSGRFIPTDSYQDGVPNSDVVFSCVGTPDNPDGSSNLTHVFDSAEQAGQLMKPGAIYVQKSTVPVGTGAKLATKFSELSKDISYVSNPEFLREGTALEDTLLFDRVVVGGNDPLAVGTVLNVYRTLEERRSSIMKIAGLPYRNIPGEYISTGLASAELIKVTANAFLALKISFANSIAKLADKSGADVVEVMNAVGADKRINRAFFNAGRGYGGGCFPKDVSGLIASGLDYGVDLDIVQATKAVNDSMPGYVAEKLQDALGGSLSGKRIAVLGLAFKAGTSDARRSPGTALANLLSSSGAVVQAYDPKASDEAAKNLVSEVHLTNTLNDCLKRCDAIVLATDWPEFTSYSASQFAKTTDARVIVDAVNALPKNDFREAGFTYLGIGR
ncbi:MAG: UDP-glucose/GDP-mannose dehydrogenase family protein [Patescibacteria group bacterium]